MGEMAQSGQPTQQAGQRITLCCAILFTQRAFQLDLEAGQRRAQLMRCVAATTPSDGAP